MFCDVMHLKQTIPDLQRPLSVRRTPGGDGFHKNAPLSTNHRKTQAPSWWLIQLQLHNLLLFIRQKGKVVIFKFDLDSFSSLLEMLAFPPRRFL